jgi:branched-chain amino acid transport system substrate-binding protein
VNGDISGGQKSLQAAIKKVTLNTAYGPIKLDKYNQGVIPVYYQQLYQKGGKLAVKTVGYIPNVDQTFGGTFSASTPAPGRTSPKCVKRSLPWIGKTQTPKVTG